MIVCDFLNYCQSCGRLTICDQKILILFIYFYYIFLLICTGILEEVVIFSFQKIITVGSGGSHPSAALVSNPGRRLEAYIKGSRPPVSSLCFIFLGGRRRGVSQYFLKQRVRKAFKVANPFSFALFRVSSHCEYSNLRFFLTRGASFPL